MDGEGYRWVAFGWVVSDKARVPLPQGIEGLQNPCGWCMETARL